MDRNDVVEVCGICLEVKEFHTTNTPEFWSKEALEKWSESSSDITLVCKENGKIIGLALVSVHVPTSKATFENLWVDENYRKQGVSKKLFNEVLRQLEEKGIKFIMSLTQEGNNLSQKAMDSFGFVRGKKFYWYEKYL